MTQLFILQSNTFLSLGWPVAEEQLREVANHAGVLEVEDDFLDARFRRECERLIPNTKN